MTDRQLYKQLQYLVLAEEWPSSSKKVFGTGSVKVTTGMEKKALKMLRHPWVIFRVGPADPDPDHGEETTLSRQTVEAVLAIRVTGDVMGQNAILGANRQAGTSKGAGLLRIQGRLLSAIGRLGPQNGITIGSFYRGAMVVQKIGERDSEVQRGYRFDAWVTQDEEYPPPNAFLATVNGADVDFTWKNPGDRFDFLTVHIRRAVGATAPAAVTDGASVYQGALELATDTAPGAATYSYSIFAEYDEDGDAAADSYSDPQTQTSVVVP